MLYKYLKKTCEFAYCPVFFPTSISGNEFLSSFFYGKQKQEICIAVDNFNVAVLRINKAFLENGCKKTREGSVVVQR